MIVLISDQLVPFVDNYDVIRHEDQQFYVCDGDQQIAGPFYSEGDAWSWLEKRHDDTEPFYAGEE